MSATFKVGIGADITGLSAGLKNADSQISSFVSKTEKIGALGDVFQNIGTKLTAGLTLPIIGLGTAAIKSYGDIQALQKGLEAVMGSSTAATQEFNKLKEVAKLPGLGLEEAARGSINLQSIGMSAEKSRNILLQFGNAVATVGKGRAEFERAIYGVQQLANTDFPLGEDLNIIKDALPQVSNLLKEAFGTSRSDELKDMGISSQKVLDVITNGLSKLPRVSGGIKGAFENLSDSMKTSLGRIGDIIDKNLNITELIDKISSGVEKLVSWFENLSPSIQTGILAFVGLAAAIGPVLVAVGGFMSMLPTITAGIGAISVAFTALTGPIGLVVLGVGAIIAVFVTQWSKIKPIILNTINYFVDLYNESKVFRVGVQSIGFAFEGLWVIVKEVLNNIWQNIKTVAKGVVESFSGVGKVIKGAFTGDLDKIAEGLVQTHNSFGKTVVGIANNTVNSVKNVFSELDNLEKKWSNNDKRKRVTDLDVSFNVPDLSNAIEPKLKEAKEKLKNKKIEPLEIVVPISIKTVQLDTTKINDPLNGIFTQEALDGLKARMVASTQEINTWKSDLQIAIEEMNFSISESWSQTLTEGLSNGISNMAETLGNAMANGGNIIEALGQSLLSTIGDIAIQLGKSAIKIGLGMIAIKQSFKNPVTAIAAGVALVALGAFIKGTVSKIPEGGSSSGGTTSTSTGSSTNSYSSSYSSGSGSGQYVFVINGYDLVSVYDKNKERLTRLGG